jgi:hypothetical protein
MGRLLGQEELWSVGPVSRESWISAHGQIEKEKPFLIFQIIYSLQIHLNLN